MSADLPTPPLASNPNPGSYVVDGVRYAADSGGELPKPADLPPLKSGFLTSSFWMALTALAGILVLAFKDKLDPFLSGILLLALPTFYGAIRSLRAHGHAELTRDLLEQAFIAAGEHVLEGTAPALLSTPDANSQARYQQSAEGQTIGQSDNQTSAEAVARGLPSTVAGPLTRNALLMLIGAALATACTTTTTTRPDGTVTVVNAQDPKVVQAIVRGVSQAAAAAAVEAIRQQAEQQNQP